MNKKSKMWLQGAVVALAFTLNANAGVNGFVDAQVATGINVTGSSDNSPTFRVADGAVYFTEKLGKSSVFVDIPFMVAGATSNNFSIATGKAQAYVSYGYDFGLTWSMGQWDTFYGFEVKDTANNRFAGQGLLYSAVPTTHTGLLVDYTNAEFTAKAFAANSNSQGLRGGDNLDYGALVKYTHSMFYVSGAYKHYMATSTRENAMLADLILGTKQGDFSADAEVLLKKNPVAGADTGVGFGIWLAYAWNSTCDFAGRFEYLNKIYSGAITSTAPYTNMQWTVGPSHKFNDKLWARLEYTGTSTKLVQGGTSTTEHGGIVSTVFKF